MKIIVMILFFVFSNNLLFGESSGRDFVVQGDSARNKGYYSEAIGKYKFALRDQPRDHYSSYYLAFCYYMTYDFESALKFFNKTIELSPDKTNKGEKYSLISFYIGNIYWHMMMDYDTAITWLEKSTQNNPEHEESFFNLGYLYRITGKYQKSLEMFNKVIELNPKNEMAYFNIGIVYVSSGEDDLALKMFYKANELNHALAGSVAVNIGLLYAKKNNMDMAVKYMRKAAYNNVALAQMWLYQNGYSW